MARPLDDLRAQGCHGRDTRHRGRRGRGRCRRHHRCDSGAAKAPRGPRGAHGRQSGAVVLPRDGRG